MMVTNNLISLSISLSSTRQYIYSFFSLGRAGEGGLIPGYPDSPYNPNQEGPGVATNFTGQTDELYRRVDRLNGLVNSVVPSLDRESSFPLQPRVTFPVGFGREVTRDEKNGSSTLPSPGPREEEEDRHLQPDTPRLETSTQETLDLEYKDDYDYTDYEDYGYGDYGSYDDYDYDTRRRKRQPGKPANEVKEIQESSSTHGNSHVEEEDAEQQESDDRRRQIQSTSKKLSTKRKKNGKNMMGETKSHNILENVSPAQSTDQQEAAQQVSRSGGRPNRRIGDLHPLKTFGLRYRRGLEYLLGKSSMEDVTWI